MIRNINISCSKIQRILKPSGVFEFNMAASSVEFAEDLMGISDSDFHVGVLKRVLKRAETPLRITSKIKDLKKCGFEAIKIVRHVIPLYETKDDSWPIRFFYESCRRCALDYVTWIEVSMALIALGPCRPYYYLYSCLRPPFMECDANMIQVFGVCSETFCVIIILTPGCFTFLRLIL